MIRFILIFLAISFTQNDLFAQNDESEHLRNSKSYYWLSRSRNNSVYEAKIALKYLDSAKTVIKGSSTDALTDEFLQKQRDEINALIEVSEDNINGHYPIFMHINQELHHQYEIRDDAIETAIESGIQMLLETNNNKTNKPLEDLVTYCLVRFSSDVPYNGNEAVLREVVKQYLSNYSKMYVLSEDETFEISNDKSITDSIVQHFGRAIKSNTFGVLNISLKNVNTPLKYIGVGFDYYDTEKGKLISSTYVESFKEDKNNWFNTSFLSKSQLLFFLFVLLTPFIAWFLFRKKDQKLKELKQSIPLFSALFIGFTLGIGVLYISIYILSFLAPSSDAFIREPLSIAWPYIFTTITFIIIPQVVFLALPLLTDKMFLRNYRDTFTLQVSIYTGILFAFQLEYFKFFQLTIDLNFIYFSFALVLIIGYFLSKFYINYYKINASFIHLYEVPLILLLSMPLGVCVLESTPDQNVKMSVLYILLISSIPYTLLRIYRKWNSTKVLDREIPPASKIAALQRDIKKQLMDYVSDKIYSPFNSNHKDLIGKNLLSLDNKRSIAFIYGKSGVGKTSLMHAIRKKSEPSVKWFYGDCDAYPENKNIPYEPFYQAFYENEFNEDISVELGTFYSGKGNTVDLLKKTSAVLDLVSSLNINTDALINSVASGKSDLSEAKVDFVISELRDVFQKEFKDLKQKTKLNLILDDLQWIDSLSEELLFKYIGLMEELTSSIPLLHFQLICIATVQTISNTSFEKLHTKLIEKCNSWEKTEFNEQGNLDIDLLPSSSFCKDFFTMASENRQLNVDIDLLETLSERVQKENLNPKNSLEVLDKLLNSDYIEVRDNLIVQKSDIDWTKISVKDKEKENFYSLFETLDQSLLKYLSSAAYIGMEFEAKILSKLWGINRLDLLHLLLEADKKGIIYDKNDRDDFYVFTSKKIRSSLRSYISSNTDENSISQIVRDYHFSLLKIELDATEINEGSIAALLENNSFLLQKVAERCQYIENSHFQESQTIYAATSIKLYEEGKFDKSHVFINKLPEDSSLFKKHPILTEIRISQVIKNLKSSTESQIHHLYEFLFRILNDQLNSPESTVQETSIHLDKVLEFNKNANLKKFNFENIAHYPKYLHGLIHWYRIFEFKEDRKEMLKLKSSIFGNPEISPYVKAKYTNSILGMISDEDKQLELLRWRFCLVTSAVAENIDSLESLIQAYSDLKISGYSYQETEDLVYMGGTLFRTGKEKIDSLQINTLGHKRILLNQVIGDRDGEYLSTLDLLSHIQSNDNTIDLIEQYTELIKKFRFSKGEKIENKIVFIYLDLLINQIEVNPKTLEDSSIEPINTIVLNALKSEPFKIRNIFKGMQEKIENQIALISSNLKNKKIIKTIGKLQN